MAELRISDADRERATADLGRHYAEGRLDHEEYDERLDAIWTARTHADLAVLFEDLPALVAPTPAAPVRDYRRPRGRLPVPLLVIAGIVALLVFDELWWLAAIAAWVLIARLHRRSPGRASGWRHGGCHGVTRRPFPS